MKITEIINEGAREGVIEPEHEAVLGHVLTMPGQNMYHGSGYLHSRFGKALAGAGAGSVPSVNMGDENWAGGDPVIKPYHPMEEEMINNAAQHVGDHEKKNWGTRKSIEPTTINRSSPVQARGPVQLKKK